ITYMITSDSYVSYTIFGSVGYVLLIALLFYGNYQATHAKVITYTIETPKKLGEKDELSILLLSDLHLGTIVGVKRLQKLMEEIRELAPDMILFAGDVLDEDLLPFQEQQMSEQFKQLSAPLGCYAIAGNHEYYGGYMEQFMEIQKTNGIHVLLDATTNANPHIHVIGRLDIGGEAYAKRKRQSLENLLQSTQADTFKIVLDHQPSDLTEPTEREIDLQVSGHTHRGQVWPGRLVTPKVFELDYGYKQKGNSHFIVSSGYGTWGPPVRIGTRSEIVQIKLKSTYNMKTK
ncbi:MAG: metallophosphoesterase, partial [Bacilli bacterium]